MLIAETERNVKHLVFSNRKLVGFEFFHRTDADWLQHEIARAGMIFYDAAYPYTEGYNSDKQCVRCAHLRGVSVFLLVTPL
jgi:hypothetical protein